MSTHGSARLGLHILVPLLTVGIGLALMIYMILVEDEPGAIPLLLIALGTGWYFIARMRARSRRD